MVGALAGLGLGGLAPAWASGTFTVGSFTKSTSAAPVTQAVVHGLGVAPKAVILWTNGKTDTTLGAGFLYAFGMTDGTTSASAATASDDNAGTSNVHRRIASKVLTLVNGTGTLLAEADLQSTDETNFTLNWTTNNATADVIHFIAIGGSRISAKVVTWAMALATGNQSVTGVGFRPDVVIHAHAGAFIASIPTTTTHGAHGLSVMDDTGAQWSTVSGSVTASNTSDTQRYQRSNKCLGGISNDLSVVKEAAWVSMDSDGFTIDHSTANAWDNMVASLALKGVRKAVGCISKGTGAAPASQAVTGLSFRPNLVLFSSDQNTASTTAATHARFGIGASDGTTAGSSAWQDTDALNRTSTDGVDKTSNVFIKVNNDTQTIDAVADMISLDAAGFMLNWTTNDAVATEICYLALAGPRRVTVTGAAGTKQGGTGTRRRSSRIARGPDADN